MKASESSPEAPPSLAYAVSFTLIRLEGIIEKYFIRGIPCECVRIGINKSLEIQ